MADTSELTPEEVQLINERRAQLAQQAEQAVHEGVAQIPEGSPNPSLSPKDLAREVWKRGQDTGARDVDIHGEFIALSAGALLRGDERFAVRSNPNSAFGIPITE